jgi:hypothetical protein
MFIEALDHFDGQEELTRQEACDLIRAGLKGHLIRRTSRRTRSQNGECCFMKQPTRLEEIQAQLCSIKAGHEQLKKQIVDLGRRAAVCQKQILDLTTTPQSQRLDARQLR